ncbi:hypothetical protein BX661DRAFT_179270 [Kickxella alabastrina]|uniref:uncharacterized protein n=1 Tax=Kickxella alabastrina TaxID=61397 RepID=UPI00222128C7|nr:uncharacterized protein BX661DRAFT_179270 [Kickxella alabastrina]KAI7833156.1 hypothetical protein BX661DRAFT_179270 [Kickxella alabastrina]
MNETAATASAQPGMGRFAYVTLVTSDAYVEGSLVLLHSLRQTMTSHSIICLATPYQLSEHSMERLRHHFDGVIETDVRLSSDSQGLELLGRPDLQSTLTKIQLWDPALFGAWHALCYLDADTLVRQSIDDLFSRYYDWRGDFPGWRDGGLVAASPDTGWPDCFNSGVLLLAPGYGCYRDLVSRASSASASFDGADQGLLNEQFADWSTSQPYRRLPFLYNATANVYYTYKPALQRFGSDVRVVHFIGVSKPWHWERTPGGQLISDPSSSERWKQLVNLWWNIHDEYVSGWSYWRGPYDKGVAFGRGYHHITQPPVSAEQLVTKAQSGGRDEDNHSGLTAIASPDHRHVLPQEVSDWDKDWSWAAKRVHPLDYTYLTLHASAPQTSDLQKQSDQQDQPDQKQQFNQKQRDHGHGISSLQDQSQDQSHVYKLVHDHSHSHSHPHVIKARDDQQYSEPPKPPAWIQSQRPWEDMAREGWLHHEEFKPHSYDQAYIERHIVEQPQNYEDHDHYDHHDHHEQPQFYDRNPHHDYVHYQPPQHEPQNQPQHQHQYQLQQQLQHQQLQHQHQDWSQPWQHHPHKCAPQKDNQCNQQQQPQQHWHQYHDMHNWNHSPLHGQHEQEQCYMPMPQPNNRPLHEATQVILQPHAHVSTKEHTHQPPPRVHRSSSARSNTGSSPIYYPQPKSPLIVNPVALWESGEEQARRRAWAQQVMAQPIEQQQSDFGNSVVSSSISGGGGGGGISWPTAPPTSDLRVPPSSMDHIDSSQLPPEIPWKIGHVRQRQSSEAAAATAAVTATANANANADVSIPPQMNMQFKEGIAGDNNARDAAGQLLQRWNEAVIARNIRSQFSDVSPDLISHSLAKVERGTDAIRLETTVSCEAEDSRGERTVYRFTLSSTLDVGGPQATPLLTPLASMPQRHPTLQNIVPVAAAPKTPHMYPHSISGSEIVSAPHTYSTNVTDMHQPQNYREPAISRRSSYVQLPPNSVRAPHMALRGSLEDHDQFAEADSRYWKLQRRLINLELSQRQRDDNLQEVLGIAPANDRHSGRSGWHKQDARKNDLTSPPTPTTNAQALEFGNQPVRRYVRRSSAFTIADPSSMQQQEKEPTVTAESTKSNKSHSYSVTNHSDRLATIEPNKLADTSASGLISPGLPKRSRSHSALRRIAVENSTQAVILPQGPVLLGDAAPARPMVNTAPPSTGIVFPSVEGEDNVNGSGNDDNNSSGDTQFASAIGRAPTPYPRDRLKSQSADRSSGFEDSAAGKRRSVPKPLHIESRDSGFEPTRFDMSPASAGTPMTPGRQKLKPQINWGDDDSHTIPSADDMSLDAQWLRIISGAPPLRAPIAPAKPTATAENTTDSNVVLVAEQLFEDTPVVDRPETPIEINLEEMATATRESLKNIGRGSPLEQTVATYCKKQPEQPAPSTRAPPHELHSTKSFLSLTSKVFDTVSDSEADPSEIELQERFWARAMKQQKSGVSTPYTPGRRKSQVGVPSAISPQDLEEWMQWQGNHGLDTSRRSEERKASGPGGYVNQQIGGLDLITPPTSKDRTGLSIPAAAAVFDKNDSAYQSGSLDMQRTRGSFPDDIVNNGSDADSSCDSCLADCEDESDGRVQEEQVAQV